jgi:hypothetical protein
MWGSVLYLTPNAPANSGTRLYMHKETRMKEKVCTPQCVCVCMCLALHNTRGPKNTNTHTHTVRMS